MKTPDLDKARSEKLLTLPEFLAAYNQDLPSQFPPASRVLLEEFKAAYVGLFKKGGQWSLDIHRKKVMDWLQMRTKIA